MLQCYAYQKFNGARGNYDGSGRSPLEALSSRELEVALMLARGRAVNDIAAQLHLSAKTVSTYKQRLFEKLDVQHTIALAHVLEAHGLLDAMHAPLVSADGA